MVKMELSPKFRIVEPLTHSLKYLLKAVQANFVVFALPF